MKNIISDQEAFFDRNAEQEKTTVENTLFDYYVNKEQFAGFSWIENSKSILEYGCGTGTSLDIFLRHRKKRKYRVYGVDIAQQAINRIKKKYPTYSFYKISNNKIPQIKNNSVDAVYMLHVLHHADSHEDIFREVHKKLKKNGKFLINDLTSNNPFNKLARSLFIHMPKFVKQRFSDDLLVGESIPEKYKVDVNKTTQLLKKSGFTIQKVGYGHLFFFIFAWMDRFLPISHFSVVNATYKQIIRFETFLLSHSLFEQSAEVFYIECVKN